MRPRPLLFTVTQAVLYEIRVYTKTLPTQDLTPDFSQSVESAPHDYDVEAGYIHEGLPLKPKPGEQEGPVASTPI